MIVNKKPNKKNKEKRITSWKRFFRKAIFCFLAISFGLVLIWVALFSPLLEVKEVLVLGLERNYQTIEKIVWDTLENDFFSFKSRSLLLFSSSKAKQEILGQSPLIKEVKIKKRFPGQIVVEVFPRKKVIAWCLREDCFLVDEEGKAFKKIEENEKSEFFVKFPTLVEDHPRQIGLGERVLSSELVDFVFSLEKDFENILKIEIRRPLTTPSFISEEIKVETKEDNLPIFLNSTISPQRQLESILALLNKLGREKLSDFEYIDSRIKGKLIYKLKGAKEEENETEEASEEFPEAKKDDQKEKENKAVFPQEKARNETARYSG